MRLKQNLTLVVLIIILLSAIFGINTLNLLSIPAGQNRESSGEIKVNSNQVPQGINSNNIEIIWDLSGSMWGEVEKKDKVSIAKDILKKIVNDLPDNVNVGMRAFGGKGEKDNLSLFIPPVDNNKEELLNFISNVEPSGKSPIGLSLIKAGEDLSKLKGRKHILLVTDGKDTGTVMPAVIIKRLNREDIKVHIIQVGRINKTNQLQLKELAKIGNGRYFTYFEEEKVVPTINLK